MSREELLAWIPAGIRTKRWSAGQFRSPAGAHRIIMDGNGRWAAQRTCRASRGIAPASMRCATPSKRPRRLGIRVLTLYAFSIENWKRPPPKSAR